MTLHLFHFPENIAIASILPQIRRQRITLGRSMGVLTLLIRDNYKDSNLAFIKAELFVPWIVIMTPMFSFHVAFHASSN